MPSFDALTLGGLIAAVGVAVFLIRTCLAKGCSRKLCIKRA